MCVCVCRVCVNMVWFCFSCTGDVMWYGSEEMSVGVVNRTSVVTGERGERAGPSIWVPGRGAKKDKAVEKKKTYQVPPKAPRISTHATFKPNCAALIAPT